MATSKQENALYVLRENTRERLELDRATARVNKRLATAARNAIDAGIPAAKVAAMLPNAQGTRGMTRDGLYKFLRRYNKSRGTTKAS